MPRGQSTDKDLILAVFKENAELVYNKKTRMVAVPSDPIWLIISNEFSAHQVKASPKYCYTLMKGDRYNLWQHLGIKEDENDVTASSIISGPETIETIESTEDEKDVGTLTFEIEFSSEEISNLIEKTQYARNDGRGSSRAYTIFKPYYWTSVIHEKFYLETRIPCAISYKKHKILERGGTYLSVDGQCKDCFSIFRGEIGEKPRDNLATIMECKYSGQFHECSASSKRRSVGPGQSALVRKLVKENKAPSYIRKKFARKNMEYNEKEPSLLPTANALSCMKYKINKKKRLDEDPVRALCILKGTPFYKGIIHDISIDRFVIHYWCTEEIQNYRMLHRLSKTPTLCIDAIGSVVKQINHLSQQESSHIFLYEIVAHDREEEIKFSVAHMLSEKHDNVTISHWLSEWLRSAKVMGPKIVVTDASLALLYAVTRSFTQYSTLAMYLSVCFKLLHGENADVPSCQIRLDVNHIMHTFSNWNIFRQKHHPRFKSFFMKSLALLVMCTDYKQALKIIKNIFIVALFEDEDKENVLSRAKNFLLAKISGAEKDVEKVSLTLENDTHIAEFKKKSTLNKNPDEPSPNSFSEEIENIFHEVSQEKEELDYIKDENSINSLFGPEIAAELLSSSKHIALWSGIMTPVFKYGHSTETSAAVESTFKDLKHVTSQHINLPIRVDIFVKKHIDMIIGDAILQKSKNIHSSETSSCDSEHGESPSGKVSHGGELENSFSREELADGAESTIERQPNLVEKINHYSQPEIHVPIKSQPESPVNSQNAAENEQFSITESGICTESKGNDLQESKTSEASVSSKKITENEQPVVENLDLNIQSDTNNAADKETDTFFTPENAVENWRNQNRVIRRRRKTHFDKDGALTAVNFGSKSLSSVIGLLKNGNSSTLQPIKLEDKFYTFVNTCPFDALIHIFCAAYADSRVYRSFCEMSKSEVLFFELISKLMQNGVNLQSYRKRGRILLEIGYEIKAGKFPNYFVVDTRGLISNLSDAIFKDHPSLIEKKICPNCQKSGERKYIVLVANLYQRNILYLEEALQEFLAEQYGCRQKSCYSTTTTSTPLFADHLLIEPTTASEQEKFSLRCKLDEVPKFLNLSNKNFKLRGIVEFLGSSDQDDLNTMGHYISYCWREDTKKWQMFDDLQTASENVKPTLIIKKCVLLVYTV